MKKIAFSMLLASSLIQAEPSVESASMSQAPISLVKVNGKNISVDYFRKYFENRGIENAQGKEQARALDELIKIQLLADLAEKDKITDLYEVKLGLDTKRMEYLSHLMLARFLQTHPVTAEDIKITYQKLTAETQSEYHIQHIQVKNKNAALAIQAEMKAGKIFENVDGGEVADLGWLSNASLPAAFQEALAYMKAGEMSQSPLESEFGWHIIKLLDKRAIAPDSLEKLTPKIEEALQKTMVSDYLNELREKAEITFNTDLTDKKGDHE